MFRVDELITGLPEHGLAVRSRQSRVNIDQFDSILMPGQSPIGRAFGYIVYVSNDCHVCGTSDDIPDVSMHGTGYGGLRQRPKWFAHYYNNVRGL